MIYSGHRQASFNNILTAFILAVAAFILYYQAETLAGGLDSYDHYLKSRYALKYHELFLDQWNKPVFTLMTVWPAQFGPGGIVSFNILCLVLSGYMIARAFAKRQYSQTWLIQVFLFYTPVLFEHSVSALTEPLNILMLSVLIVWHMGQRNIPAALMAGLLPFVRTEGFVLMGAYALIMIFEKKYKYLPLLLGGSLIMNFIGWFFSGEVLWIITSNPYFRFEMDGQFDPGSGSWLHFFAQGPRMFGLIQILFLFFAHLKALSIFRKKEHDTVLYFTLIAYWFYFMAHVLVYKFGILGSHGLTRPMAVLAPLIAVSCFYGFNYLMDTFSISIRKYSALLSLWLMILSAYHLNHYPYPYQISKTPLPLKMDEAQRNFMNAGKWLKEKNLMSRTIIHQSPFFDVMFDKDPYDVHSSYRIWSIDQPNDWSEPGVIVLWDAYYAQREGNMKIDWLRTHKDYRELHFIKDKQSDNSGRFDLYIFEKRPLEQKQ